jgi:hypothetical protein
VVIVIVLPLSQIRIEQMGVVRNPVAIEELVELLVYLLKVKTSTGHFISKRSDSPQQTC